MLRDARGVGTQLLRYSRNVLAIVTIAALASACGIKGPLKPAPAASVQPATTPVPAPNAPAPAQEPPPPVPPRP